MAALALENIEIDQINEGNNVLFLGLDFTAKDVFDDCEDRLRSLFDQVIPIFLKDVSLNKSSIRPIPALLGDGQPADLFKLFWVVMKRGGFDAVSNNGLWGLVTKECGLNVGLMASVKLIYSKYLKELNPWLQQVLRDERSENGEIGIVKKLNLLSAELEEFRGSVFGSKKKKRNHGNLELKSNEIRSFIDLDVSKCELNMSDCRNPNTVHDNVERSNDDGKDYCIQEDGNMVVSAKCIVDKVINSQKSEYCLWAGGDREHKNIDTIRNDDDEEVSVQDNDDVVLLARSVVDKIISSQKSEYKDHENAERRIGDGGRLHVQDDDNIISSSKSVVDEVSSSRKRKRQPSSFPRMLNWVTEVAKRSDDPAIGVIPAPSKWKEHGREELWLQALLAREMLLLRRPIDAGAEEPSDLKKLKTHPSMYEDKNLHQQTTERQRCSKRLPLTKSQFCPCCNPGPASPCKLSSPRKAEAENNLKEVAPMTVEIPNISTPDDLSTDEPLEKHVSVGPLFQAEVPAWTGVVLESDPKWLGIRMWPPQDGKNNTLVENHPVGKGRQNSCNCRYPGSVTCVSFHIAEKRMKLKLELGTLFFWWRFNRMGEEVSLSWTTEEEKRFKNMVQQNSEGQIKFWNKVPKFFPTKTREKLVSYYFNVLLLRRRSYQNRVTPKDIDSDDDEIVFGSISHSAYYEGNQVKGSQLLICSQNMQCTELE